MRAARHSVAASREKIHSRDRNLWHISHEGGELEDAATLPCPQPGRSLARRKRRLTVRAGEDRFQQRNSGLRKRDGADPCRWSNCSTKLAHGTQSVASIWWRTVFSELNHADAMKRLRNSAHCRPSRVGGIVPGTPTWAFQQHIGLKYAELVYFGLWFYSIARSPRRFVETTQREMTGSATSLLYKECVGGGRESEHSLYRTTLFLHHGRSYDQKMRPVSSAFSDCLHVARPPPDRRSHDEDVVRRFRQPLDPEFETLGQRSFEFDCRLLRYDSQPAAPMPMLSKPRHLTADD